MYFKSKPYDDVRNVLWDSGQDFTFLEIHGYISPKWYIPASSISSNAASVAVIGYANLNGLINEEDRKERYGPNPPSYSFFKLLFDENHKFISPGPFMLEGFNH